MVTIYQTAPRSPKRGTALCLFGVLVLCIAGGIWGFRHSRRSGEENLESYGIVVENRPARDETPFVIDEQTFAHVVDPAQRRALEDQSQKVRTIYNGREYLGRSPMRFGQRR